MINYSDKHKERMHPKIEESAINGKHSLGKHPSFPEDDDNIRFDEKLISDRFAEVVKNLKRYMDVDDIDNESLPKIQIKLIKQCVELEKSNKKELQDLAIEFIRKHFDIPEKEVKLEANLVDDITLKNKVDNKDIKLELNDHSHLKNLNKEIYKRRLINALVCGLSSSSIVHKLIHEMNNELSDINPRLPNIYCKVLAINDYLLFVHSGNNKKNMLGGEVAVGINDEDVKIEAQALIFPVLVCELAKGVGELLAENGLPENEEESNYVKQKSDLEGVKKWDNRLGPALWNKIKSINENTNSILYRVFANLISKPVDEFNECMMEIFANTKKGKNMLMEISNNIEKELKECSFNEALENKRNEFKSNKYMDVNDLDNVDLNSL